MPMGKPTLCALALLGAAIVTNLVLKPHAEACCFGWFGDDFATFCSPEAAEFLWGGGWVGVGVTKPHMPIDRTVGKPFFSVVTTTFLVTSQVLRLGFKTRTLKNCVITSTRSLIGLVWLYDCGVAQQNRLTTGLSVFH